MTMVFPRKRMPTSKRHSLLRRKLRFSPTAWGKLVYMRDLGPTEIGGFGISDPDDPLLVTDFILIRQTCSMITVSFDDDAVADFFDEQVNAGRQPSEFARIWIHTHPGESPVPSSTDEQTFKRCFGTADWAVMFILAKEGATYGRLRCGVKPRVSRFLAYEVDYSQPFAASDHGRWKAEYQRTVSVLDPFGDQGWPGTPTLYDGVSRHGDLRRGWQERLRRRDGQYFAAFDTQLENGSEAGA